MVGGILTPLKNISQMGLLFPIYGKIKNVPNHQPDMYDRGIYPASQPFPQFPPSPGTETLKVHCILVRHAAETNATVIGYHNPISINFYCIEYNFATKKST